MRRVFNGGLGYVAIVPPGHVATALEACAGAGCEAWLVGEIVPGEGVELPGGRLAPCALGVLVSGSGSNLQALIERVHGRSATIAGVCSSNADAFALERARARRHPEPRCSRSPRTAATRERRDARDGRLARPSAASSSSSAPASWACSRRGFLERFPDRVLNLHPSLLPAFPGAHAIEDALAAGVRETGVTVHLVDEVLDGGPDRRPGAPAGRTTMRLRRVCALVSTRSSTGSCRPSSRTSPVAPSISTSSPGRPARDGQASAHLGLGQDRPARARARPASSSASS